MFPKGEYMLTLIQLPLELIDGTINGPMRLNSPAGLIPVSMLKFDENHLLILWFNPNQIQGA